MNRWFTHRYRGFGNTSVNIIQYKQIQAFCYYTLRILPPQSSGYFQDPQKHQYYTGSFTLKLGGSLGILRVDPIFCQATWKPKKSASQAKQNEGPKRPSSETHRRSRRRQHRPRRGREKKWGYKKCKKITTHPDIAHLFGNPLFAHYERNPVL